MGSTEEPIRVSEERMCTRDGEHGSFFHSPKIFEE